MPISGSSPIDRLMVGGGQLILTKVGNNLVLTKSTNVSGNVIISDAEITDLSSSITVESDNTIDLGSSTKKFRNIYGHVLVGDMSGDDWTFAGAMRITPATAGATTLTLSNSGAGTANLNLSDGHLLTGGTQRLTNNGALSNITTITTSDDIRLLSDSKQLEIGGAVGGDLRIYHDSSNSFITNVNTGGIYITNSVAAGNIINRLKGTLIVQDANDSNVALFTLDTSARSLSIGVAADTIATVFEGNVNLVTGTLSTAGTERLSNAGALLSITGISFTDANQTIGLTSASDRTIVLQNAGAGALTFNVNGTLQIAGTSITATANELNKIDGYNGTATELNYLKAIYDTGVTSAEIDKLDGFTGGYLDLNYAKDLRATEVTTAEFDKLDGLTSSTTELNLLNGVTSLMEDVPQTVQFLAASALQKSTGKPAYTEVQGGFNCYTYLSYSASSSNVDDWAIFFMPDNYDGGNITVEILWFTTDDTAGHQVRWEFKYKQYTEGDLIGAEQTTIGLSCDVNATSGDLEESIITSTLTLTAGKWTQIGLRRDHDYEFDDCTTSARFLGLTLTYNVTS